MAVGLLMEVALAAPFDEQLARVDAAIGAHQAARVPITEGDFCGPSVPGPAEILPNRSELCRDTEAVGLWRLENLVASGGERVDAVMGLRRYTTTEAAERARRLSFARFGAGPVDLHEGAISWCYADAVWNGRWLWTLEYGCHISIAHVPALAAAREVQWKAGESYNGAFGVVGSHSGHGWLGDAAGGRHTVAVEPQ